ncbi:hypothetical protein, partial [Rhodoblastus sphagnicola]|uniref:hypothetical protein n=1 Tax=Rhodoblastus sphagnicola TaxID=333368 RepID=UPI001AED4335
MEKLEKIGLGPTDEEPCDLIADKGYHSREGLKDLADRDRGTPRSAAPPTPPGIRVRTTAVRPSYA